MRHAHAHTMDWLKVGGSVALVIVALPLLALAAFLGRGVLLAAALLAVVAGLAAFAVSPAFRTRLAGWTEPEMVYNGLRLATPFAYHPFHAWARIEGDEATLGADDLVQTVLGPLDDVELPEVGARVRQGWPLARLVRGDRRVDLPSPLSGTVVATNERLDAAPALVNREPFGDGWLARVKGDGIRDERQTLLRGEEARSWFRREVDRLISRLVPGETAPVLADGGAVTGDLHRFIDDVRWRRLAEEFFGAEGA